MKQSKKFFFIIEVLLALICFVVCYFINNTFIIIPYLIIVLVFLKQEKYRYSPMLFFVVPWTFMFVMYNSDFITYTQDKEENVAILYMFVGCVLVYLGYKLALKIKLNIPKWEKIDNEEKNVKNIKKLFNIMALIGIIGSLLFIAEMIFTNGIKLSVLSSARNTFTERETTILSQIGNVLSWGAIFTLPAIILFSKQASKIEKILWTISIISYSMYSIFSAGRQVIFQILIITICSFLIKQNVSSNQIVEKEKNKKYDKKTLLLILLIIVLCVGYMLKVANDRNDGKISTRKFDVLTFYMGCELNPKVEAIYNMLPSNIGDSISEAIVYYTHEIPEFKIFWNIDESVGPFMGLYSAPFIDRRIAPLGLSSYSVEDKMAYVRNYMSSQGAMAVGWKTFFSFLILDYGRIGGLIYCAIYGFYVGCVYKNFLGKRTIMSAIWLIRTCVGLFYTVMFPATCETGLLIMGIFCIFMNFIENGKKIYRYYI